MHVQIGCKKIDSYELSNKLTNCKATNSVIRTDRQCVYNSILQTTDNNLILGKTTNSIKYH